MATSSGIPFEHSREQGSKFANAVEGRYADAYRMANFQVALGVTIKNASLAIGGLIALVSALYMFGSNQVLGGGLAFLGIIAAAVAGGLGWLFGTLISSQGQLTKASLDGAVHTSPFLDDERRARIMSL